MASTLYQGRTMVNTVAWWWTMLLFLLLRHSAVARTYSPNDLSPQPDDSSSTHNGLAPGDLSTEVVIQTKVGRIQGLVVNSSGAVTTRFLGVPYARPPIGDLRFRPPQKHPGWAISAALQATEYRFSCKQGSSHSKPNQYTKDRADKLFTSEDCLYLNVFLPMNLSKAENLNTLSYSVMVFIHGGEFASDSANLYEGWHMAAHGNVIVVGVEYRLGVLGFLSTQDSAAPGNLGLWDQRLALHWIWDNIREFGGNPETITIFGEGAGGISVGYHVVSPKSRALFTRAISQSGTMLSPCCLQRRPVAMAMLLAERANCPTSNTSDLVECLRQLPVDELMRLSQDLATSHNQGWFPVIDKDFIPDEPRTLMAEGKHNWVDYIVGVNNHIGYSLPSLSPTDVRDGISLQDFESWMKRIIQNFLDTQQKGDSFEELYASVLLEYAFCENSPQELAKILMDLYGDMHYMAPSALTARLMSHSDKNTYFYTFSYRGQNDGDIPNLVQATGGDELNFLFGGDSHVTKRQPISDEERRLRRAMLDAWTNFAKTGNPNPVNDRGVNWRPFDEFSRHYIDFTEHMDKRAVQEKPWPRQTAYWNDYIPHLLKAGRSRNQNCGSQELCSTLARNVLESHSKASTAMWALAGACVLLFLCLVILLAMRCVANHHKNNMKNSNTTPKKKMSKQQEKCLRGKYNGSIYNDTETRKLHPLPYCDET